MAITNVTVQSTVTTQVFLASAEQVITTAFFCNHNTATSTTLDIFLVPSGRVASTSTQIMRSLPLPPTETFVFDAEKIVFNAGDSLQARASVNGIVVATVSYIQTS